MLFTILSLNSNFVYNFRVQKIFNTQSLSGVTFTKVKCNLNPTLCLCLSIWMYVCMHVCVLVCLLLYYLIKIFTFIFCRLSSKKKKPKRFLHSFNVELILVVGEVGEVICCSILLFKLLQHLLNMWNCHHSLWPFPSYCVFCYTCRLGDVLSSLTSKKDVVPYENSMLTQILGDSLGIQFSF